MKNIKTHFYWYNKRQRNGFLFLVIIIIVAQAAYIFIDFSPDKMLILSSKETIQLQKEIDSLKALKAQPKKYVIRPFNPSFLTGYKAYSLGLNTDEIDKLLAYRKQDKYINSAKQFQKITGVSDSLLAVLKPLFKFPDWVMAKQNEAKKPKEPIIIKNINTVIAQDLVVVKGIGLKTANRIINYRNMIKGFTFKSQLYEVYYLDTIVANRVLERFRIFKKPEIDKINVNTATFKEILHLPYIDYQLTKNIFDYKREVTEIKDLEELKKLKAFHLINLIE